MSTTPTTLRRPRHGTVKQRCFDEYFGSGAEAAIRHGVEQGVKEASVRRWIYDWAVAQANEQTAEHS